MEPTSQGPDPLVEDPASTGAAGVHPGFDVRDYPPAREALAALVRTRLPADWQRDVRVVQVPGGFAVGFVDATGGRHVLRAHLQEAGFRTLVQGRRFNFAYRQDTSEPEEPATVARYRAVVEGLLGQEEPLSEMLRPAANEAPIAPEANETWQGGLNLRVLPPVSEKLAAWVKELLPADWRGDLQVVRAPGGFAAGFTDAAGAWHVVRAQELEGSFYGLAQGRHLGFSYLQDDLASEDPATQARYQTVATDLLAQEEALANDLRPAEPGHLDDQGPGGASPQASPSASEVSHPGFDLNAYPSASEALVARVRARLPTDWQQNLQVVQVPGGFAVGFVDATGGRYVLRAHLHEAGFRTLAQGRRFNFAYHQDASKPEDPTTVARYRAVVDGLLGHEEPLSEMLRPAANEAPIAPEANEAWQGGLNLRVLPPVSEKLAVWVSERLPADWRGDLQVVRAPGGFAAGFTDAAGAWHVLRAWELEADFRTLAQGRDWVFSYLEDAAARANPAAVATYQTVATELLAQEDALANDLRTTRTESPGFDVHAYPPADKALSARVRALLPADWHENLQVVRFGNGFAVEFHTAGVRHVLRVQWREAGREARFPSVGSGHRFSYGYLKDAAAPDAPTVARYRTVVAGFLPHEDQIAEDLHAAHLSPGFGLLGPPPGHAGLASRLSRLLPADWREDVRVMGAPGGFGVVFRDASGYRHILRAWELEPDFHVLAEGPRFHGLAEGRHFSFSYLRDSAESDDAAIQARVRKIVAGFLGQEETFADDLRAAHADDTDKQDMSRVRESLDRPVTVPVSETLAAQVRTLLPVDWQREVQVVRAPGGFVVGFQDRAGVQHALRAQSLEAGVQAVIHVQGRRYGFSYLEAGVEPDQATVLRYRAVLEGFLPQEDALAEGLASKPVR